MASSHMLSSITVIGGKRFSKHLSRISAGKTRLGIPVIMTWSRILMNERKKSHLKKGTLYM